MNGIDSDDEEDNDETNMADDDDAAASTAVGINLESEFSECETTGIFRVEYIEFQ